MADHGNTGAATGDDIRAGYAPLGKDDWPEDIADMHAGFAGALNVYRSIAHHPALVRAMADLREHVVIRTALGPELSEVVILRAGHRLGSVYEVTHHIDRARRLGMVDARIESVLGDPAPLSDTDAAIVAAVDELFDAHELSTDSIADLTARIGKHGVLDLIATVGYYSILGFVLKSFSVPLDPAVQDRVAATPLRSSQ